MKTVIVLALAAFAANAQSSAGLICSPSANPPIVHAEGVAERLGDIVLSCSGGAPGATATGNFSVFLNTNITNHLTGSDVSDAVLTVDSGSGPVPSAGQARLVGPNQLAFNGVAFTLSATGQAILRISNLRGDMTRVAANPTESANANLAINGPSQFALSGTAFSVGRPSSSLFSLILTTLRCSQAGSPLPSSLTWNGLIAAGTAYASARVTEGYATAFGAREAGADTGIRIISHYSDFPAGARLLVPDVIAGSTAPQPTSTGDFGSAASPGSYAPGSLLLVRVLNTDANGAGGTLAYTGPGTPPFGAVSDVALANGEGIAVYEVVDSNPSAIENAQIPVFLGLAPGGSYSAITKQDLRLGPVSTVDTASATAPIPRFLGGSAGSDCALNGDCDGSYLPKLGAYYNPDPLVYEAVQGGPQQDRWLRVVNEGQGELLWTTSVVYKNGSGWVLASPAAGAGKGSVRVDVVPENLVPGTYEATLIIDAGVGGRATFPISLVVKAGPPPSTTPTITQVIHAATYQASAFVAGSIGTLKGSFPGQERSVTFDGMKATLLYQDAKQINLIVPAELAGHPATQVVVTGDGVSSAPVSVNLVDSAPGIFPRGVLNLDYSVNEPTNPVAAGSFVQIYSTGLFPPSGGAVLAKLGGQPLAVLYAGPAPGFPGVQQVNLQIPAEMAAGNVDLQLCAVGVCSPPVTVSVRQ